MLRGLDVSHHNKNMKNLADINSYDFIIIKASEGRSYKDNFRKSWLYYLSANSLKGFYHFARPEAGNTPEQEARNFLDSIKGVSYPFIVALDVEAGALNYKKLDEWCLEWCKYVDGVLGYKPLIYCSLAETHRFKKCAEWGCGLWVAKWDKDKPRTIQPWDFWAIWQYTNSGTCSAVRVDEDYFNGDREQFLKYAGVISHEGENTDTDNSTDRTVGGKRKRKRTSSTE